MLRRTVCSEAVCTRAVSCGVRNTAMLEVRLPFFKQDLKKKKKKNPTEKTAPSLTPQKAW